MRTYDTIFDLITISTKFEKLCTYLFLTSKVSRSQPKSMVLMVRISSDAHFDSTNKTNDQCTRRLHSIQSADYTEIANFQPDIPLSRT